MDKPLYIFDFDDTLVFSGAAVHVTHANGQKESLESHEFATYVEQPGDEFDFSEFDIYPPSGRVIKKSFNALEQAISTYGPDSVIVLSARAASQPMQQFLQDNGLSAGIDIIGVGSANPTDKATVVDRKLSQGNFNSVIVYEDSMANINAIKAMVSKKYPDVTFQSHHVQAESLLRKTIHNLLKEITFCRK